MKRSKHNKKRNTAFLYEALVREATKAVVSGNKEMKLAVVNILKESFSPKSVLSKELDLYKALLDTDELEPLTAEKLVFQVREAHSAINKSEIYEAQSHLIKRINKELSSGVYNNFVPNYKNLATVAQLFGTESEEISVKAGVLLEQQVVESLTSHPSESQERKMKPIDNLVFNTFVSKYNEKYSNGILGEQKELLSRYIFSFSDNSVDVSIYLNEELGRLHGVLTTALETDEVRSDDGMTESTREVLSMIEGFKETPVDKELIEKVLKIQNLAHEIEER